MSSSKTVTQPFILSTVYNTRGIKKILISTLTDLLNGMQSKDDQEQLIMELTKNVDNKILEAVVHETMVKIHN